MLTLRASWFAVLLLAFVACESAADKAQRETALDVEPGTFSADRPRIKESLARLRRFVARHPHIDVRLGHQLKAAEP